MKVNGVFITDYMKLDVTENKIPDEPKVDEILIKAMVCGVCCWDSWLYHGVSAPGPMPYVIGHEGVGIVEKMDSLVTSVRKGGKVFVTYGGNDMVCEYFINRVDGIVKPLDDTTDWAGVVYEPTYCVMNLLNIANIKMGNHVVLMGAGYMGMLTLMGLTRSTRAGRITVFELWEDRREIARGLNPTETLDPESEEGKRMIKEIQDKGGADVVVDFGASNSGFHLADSMTKMAGKFVIDSFHREDVTFNGTKWHLGGLTVYNLSPFSSAHYPDMTPRTYTMIKKGVLRPAKFVVRTAYLRDAQRMENMFRRTCDKKDDYIKGAVLFYES